MSSHSRVKGKAKKSGASAAKSAKKLSSVPRQRKEPPVDISHMDDNPLRGSLGSVRQENDDTYTITREDVTRAVYAAVDTLPGTGELPDGFAEALLDNIHNGLNVEASREDQCAAHLAASIVTALKPFLAGA